MMYILVESAYLAAIVLFILALYWMNAPKSARRSVSAGVAAMALAIAATWSRPEVIHHYWVIAALLGGILVGVPLSRVALTAVPQRTALSHAFGGLAAGLVGTAKYYLWYGQDAAELTGFRMTAIVIETLLGFLTLTGSLMAAGKLHGVSWMPQRPVVYRFQNVTNLALLLLALGCGALLIVDPTGPYAMIAFPTLIVLSLMFGILLIIPIGGADMPTVISILNAYAGLSAVAMGFVLDSRLLVVAGALDGASGLILSIVMCRAMNRSFTNVLFGGFGQVHETAAGGAKEERQYKEETIEGAAQALSMARLVVIVPGYGMAVAHAQHRIAELYDLLTARGTTVKFVIHPVAGRMPGHMNVLLAEAEIPYDDIVEMDDMNPDMPQVDVALIVGANDVVNPAAKEKEGCPIYGMPIIEAHRAKTVFAIKRGKSPGFAGIENDLYFKDETFMLFGDAKHVVGELTKQLAVDAAA
jgi:NAD(P) transhydrogenase subunit beta